MLKTSLRAAGFFALAFLLIGTARSDAPLQLNTANVTVDCLGGYQLSVTGVGDSAAPSNTIYTVSYSITVTPQSGSPTTITGSFNVTPDSSNGFNFSQAISGSLGSPLPSGATLSGSATLTDNAGSPSSTIQSLGFTYPTGCTSPPPPPPCAATTTNTSNFNGTPINAGTYIWFNANFTASGIPSTGTTILFNNSTISFTAGQTTYNLSVPNAQITFSPSASCASTTFDSGSNTWITTVPLSGSDEIFLTGLAFPVPATFGGKDVTWTGTFQTASAGVSMNWKWGAAVYTTFTTDYNALGVKPTHTKACLYNNSDHAGTPEGIDSGSGEPFKKFVIGGARGGGGSNFTGSWSGTVSVKPVCIE